MWTELMDNVLFEFYAERGPEWCAKKLRISHKQALNRTVKLRKDIELGRHRDRTMDDYIKLVFRKQGT